MPETEAILLQRFAESGDPEAFSEIVRRHAGLVYGACLRVVCDRDRAADIAQETFFQLLRNAGQITGSLPSWLHKVATHKAIDRVRKDSARRQREIKYTNRHVTRARTWEEISPYVDEALDDLDPGLKQIIVAHFLEGRTTREIATTAGVSQATVSRRIEAGVNQLRGKLRKRGIVVVAAALAAMLTDNTVKAAPAVVLQELGKMALVGSSTAAATTTTATILGSLQAKLITAAAVAVIGVGSVATYKHITADNAQTDRPTAGSDTAAFTSNQPDAALTAPGAAADPASAAQGSRPAATAQSSTDPTSGSRRSNDPLPGRLPVTNPQDPTAMGPLPTNVTQPITAPPTEGAADIGFYYQFGDGRRVPRPQTEPNDPNTLVMP